MRQQKSIKILIMLLLITSLHAPFLFASRETLENLPQNVTNIQELTNWLAREFTYKWEYPDKWQSTQETIDMRSGDCEDFAILASTYLTRLGIRNDIVIIKFRDLSVSHAVCVWKNESGLYSFISGSELKHTNKENLEDAIGKFYPDWEEILLTNAKKEYTKVLARN